jgi:diguanylate cyclase (GGDEF)-like protein
VVSDELVVSDERAGADDRGRLLAQQRELAQAQRELAAHALRDPATGLYSRRAFDDRVREELARARRHERSVSLLVGEIDDFDGLEARMGREYADHVLREVARLLSLAEESRVRESDVVARLDDRAFAIVLLETDRSGAAIKANRLRQAVAQTDLPGSTQLTISLGMACAPHDTTEADELIAYARRALDMARAAGRNRQSSYLAPAGRPGAEDAQEKAALSIVPRIPTMDTGAFRMAHTLVSEIARGLSHSGSRALLYVDMSQLEFLRVPLGSVWHGSVHERVATALEQMLGEELSPRDRLCRTESQDFLCVLATERSDAELRDLARVSEAVATRLAHVVAGLVPRELRDLAMLTVEGARVLAPFGRGSTDAVTLLSRLIAQARDACKTRVHARRCDHRRQLVDALASDQISAVYRPVVDLDKAEIVAYWARPRGPGRSPLESWRALRLLTDDSTGTGFATLARELDYTAVRRAFRSASGLAPAHKLLVGLRPRTLYDTSFMQAQLDEFLIHNPLDPSHAVLCITEPDALEHFIELRRALPVYASKGFGIAIEDVGGQGSALEAVLQLEPRFLCLSAQVTSGLATSRSRRQLARSMVRLAESIDARPVAVSVDGPDDLRALLDVGIHHGVGDFLARSGAPFPHLRAAVKRALEGVRRPLEPISVPPADPWDA